ncbi:MAG: hypothetical protein ACLVH9_04870 [Fusobacterium sp.]|uniref:hypothetical protein n=1 Tax=Fusobacterium sp. TaxID=68766 RepID=UPI00399A7D09
MHLKEENSRKKGFLMLSVFFIITLIMGTLFIGYRIVYSKGKRIISYLEGQKLNIDRENIETIVYSELYKIDLGINEGKFENSLDYFARSKEIKRVWENKDGTILTSNGGYKIRKILYEGKEIYRAGNGNFYSKLVTTLKNGRVKNSFKIELEKNIENREIKLKFIAKVVLEYKFQNINLEAPDLEKIEEVVVSKYV